MENMIKFKNAKKKEVKIELPLCKGCTRSRKLVDSFLGGMSGLTFRSCRARRRYILTGIKSWILRHPDSNLLVWLSEMKYNNPSVKKGLILLYGASPLHQFWCWFVVGWRSNFNYHINTFIRTKSSWRLHQIWSTSRVALWWSPLRTCQSWNIS